MSARFTYHTILDKITAQLSRLSLLEDMTYRVFNLTCSLHFEWLTVCVQWQLLFYLVLHDPKHLAPPVLSLSQVQKLPTKERSKRFGAIDNHATTYLV